jgi:acyl carrier protein
MKTSHDDSIYSRVMNVLKDVMSVDEDEIKEDTRFSDDLGADSVDLVTLICALEDEFDGKIDDDEAEALITVGDTVTFIREKVLKNEQE